MEEDVIPSPLKNFTPRANPPRNVPPESHDIALTASELSKLEGMTHSELVALVRRLTCQCGLAATMTDEETAQAMLDTLADTALKPVIHGTSMKADITARMTAIEKWMDRKRGKPIGTSPLVQIGASGDINVVVRLVDSQGNVEVIDG